MSTMSNESRQAELLRRYELRYTFTRVDDIDACLAEYGELAAQPPCSFVDGSRSFASIASDVRSIGNVYAVSLADRFGDIGTVAYFCACLVDERLHVTNVAASARAYHKGLEAAILQWAARAARAVAAHGALVHAHRTQANAPSIAAYQRAGAVDLSFVEGIAVFQAPGEAPRDASGEAPFELAIEHGISADAFALHDMPAPDMTAYISPHQDDELFTWGIDISQRAECGNVAVLLMTDGAQCAVRTHLAEGRLAEGLEGGSYDLTPEEFSRARDAEFAESCKELGVPERNVHFADPRLSDMGVTVEAAEAAITGILAIHPFARICAHAPRPESLVDRDPAELSQAPHVDHCLVGQAVERLRAAGRVNEAEYCVEFYDLARFGHDTPDIPLAHRVARPVDMQRVSAAGAAYRNWNPNAGRYAIGWSCDPNMHAIALENRANYYYDPMALYGSGRERRAFERAARESATADAETSRALARLAEVEGSTTWKAGRAVTALPRKLKDALSGRKGK